MPTVGIKIHPIHVSHRSPCLWQRRLARDFDDDRDDPAEPLTPTEPLSPPSWSYSPPRSSFQWPHDLRDGPGLSEPETSPRSSFGFMDPCDDVPEALVYTSSEAPYGVLEVNQAWTKLCGWSRREALGSTIDILKGDARQLEGLTRAVVAGRRGDAVFVATKKDGTRFLAWLRLMPLCDDDDSLWPTRFVGILEDHCSMRRAPSL